MTINWQQSLFRDGYVTLPNVFDSFTIESIANELTEALVSAEANQSTIRSEAGCNYRSPQCAGNLAASCIGMA